MSDGFAFLFVVVVVATISTFVSNKVTDTRIMKDAYEKGVAFECLGKTGYHFTCDDVKK